MERIYLDNAATTRVHPEVVAAMVECMRDTYGNPSSPHRMGLEAEARVRRAREELAAALGVGQEEIVFTSGGTEANNLAIRGVLRAFRRRGGNIVHTATEHPSVLETCAALREEGFEVRPAPVTSTGEVDEEALSALVDEKTRLVSIALVNNEIGTVQPISRLVAAVRRKNPAAAVHVDAVQALGKVEVRPKAWGIDLLSVSGHKIHGPKGIGALYVRHGVRLHPVLTGGGQEQGLRSGTENVPGIVGFGRAAALAAAALPQAAEHMRRLRRLMFTELARAVPGVRLVGPELEKGAPHILNVALPGVKGEVMVRLLSEKGVYVSTGSACSSKKRAASHVLAALGLPPAVRDGSLRISFSAETTEEQVLAAAGHIAAAYRELSQT